MKITENFNSEEFTCPCCGMEWIDRKLVHRLQVIRDIIGCPIVITSGCRCTKHNAEVGGKESSYHLLGEAADWTTKDPKTDERVALHLIPNWSGGFHWYPEKSFIHCDLGNWRRWN